MVIFIDIILDVKIFFEYIFDNEARVSFHDDFVILRSMTK